jgi:signal transduction histidine kinase
MRDKTLDERQIKQLNLIQNNAWRLERMIDDLLHVAAVDFGGLSYDIRQVDVVNTVKDVFDSLKPVASAPKRRLVWRESTTKALAAIDPIRMAQAVQNIVSNAIKYSPIDSGITVSTYESDGSVEILVRNKGKLSKSDTELAFSRFTRLDNELTRSTLGTGLGLSITREILEAMDGSVTLESDQIHIEAKIRIPILAK